jgi:alanine racemase
MTGAPFHPSRIELSQSALRHNVRFLRELIGPQTALCSVIKGNAYGHGIRPFVAMARKCGLDRFAVFSADEAYEAWTAADGCCDVVVMGEIDGDALAWAVESGVAFYAFDLERLDAAAAAATRTGRPARVHIELETGLNRTGFDAGALPSVVERLARHGDALKVEGLCTHFAGAESTGNYWRIRGQVTSFGLLADTLREAGVHAPRHTACSAAAFVFPETRMDMVRFGIAQYGFWPSQETRMHHLLQQQQPEGAVAPADPLQRVLKWESRVMSVKRVKAGEFVGYGTSYLTTRPQTVAGVPVGYFHGFSRSRSNLGHVLVHGRRAPVIGLVNMSMLTVDVTDIDGVRAGDEVVVIGRQRKAQITVGAFSDLTGDLNYEVLVRLPSEIPRIIVP